MGLEKYHELCGQIEKFLRPETFPLAVKLIKKESEIPDKSVRPAKDYKQRIMLCQGWSIAKTTGRTVAFTWEDNCCMEAAAALGWKEKPPYMKDGSAVYPRLALTPEIGKKLEDQKGSIDTKEGYIGMVISPLGWTRVQPDVVLISLNAARLCRALDSITGQTGDLITTQNNGRGGTCIWGFVPVMKTGKPTFTVPTFGEFRFTADSDNDMYLVLPESYLEPLAKGLEHSHKSGQRYPIPHFVEVAPNYPGDYKYSVSTYEKYCASADNKAK